MFLFGSHTITQTHLHVGMMRVLGGIHPLCLQEIPPGWSNSPHSLTFYTLFHYPIFKLSQFHSFIINYTSKSSNTYSHMLSYLPTCMSMHVVCFPTLRRWTIIIICAPKKEFTHLRLRFANHKWENHLFEKTELKPHIVQNRWFMYLENRKK